MDVLNLLDIGHDKIQHFSITFLVGLLLGLIMIILPKKERRINRLFMLWAMMIFIGTIEEYRQWFDQDRSTEFYDAIANTLGISAGLFIPFVYSVLERVDSGSRPILHIKQLLMFVCSVIFLAPLVYTLQFLTEEAGGQPNKLAKTVEAVEQGPTLLTAPEVNKLLENYAEVVIAEEQGNMDTNGESEVFGGADGSGEVLQGIEGESEVPSGADGSVDVLKEMEGSASDGADPDGISMGAEEPSESAEGLPLQAFIRLYTDLLPELLKLIESENGAVMQLEDIDLSSISIEEDNLQSETLAELYRVSMKAYQDYLQVKAENGDKVSIEDIYQIYTKHAEEFLKTTETEPNENAFQSVYEQVGAP